MIASHEETAPRKRRRENGALIFRTACEELLGSCHPRLAQ
jgi:hypothetical protein